MAGIVTSNSAGTLKRHQVYQYLRSNIISREIKRGQHLSERQLAKHFGVTRATVRAALARLSSDELVQNVAGMGSFVTDHDENEIKESIYLRSLHEGAAAKFAAGRINRFEAEELRKLLDNLKQAIESNDAKVHNLADTEFHKKIASICGNEKLQSLILNGLGLKMLVSLEEPEFSKAYLASIDEHTELLEAIIAGDGEKAEQLMRFHITKSINGYIERFHKDRKKVND